MMTKERQIPYSKLAIAIARRTDMTPAEATEYLARKSVEEKYCLVMHPTLCAKNNPELWRPYWGWW